MSVPEIIGHPFSTCTRRVLVVAYHFGLVEGKDFTFTPIDFAAVAEPGYPQPFKQVPYLKDGELIIYESRAMSKYLLAKNGLYPTEAAKIGLFEQACSVEVSNFDPAASGLAAEKVFKKMRGLETDEHFVEAHIAALAKRLPGYEVILSKNKYLAGSEITAADLFHLPYGKMASDLGGAPQLTNESEFPNLSRWWKEISTLPAWAQANDKIPK